MRFILKLVILAAICFAIYHFFGPQIESFLYHAKNEIHHFLEAHHPKDHHQTNQERKYYPIEKRTQ